MTAAARASARVAAPALALVRAAVALASIAAVVRAPEHAGAVEALLRDGRAIVAAHAPVVRFGPESAAAGAYDGGIGWLAALTAVLLASTVGDARIAAASAFAALGALALVELRARALGGPWRALGATAIAGACMLDGFGAGGGASSWLCAAALALALDASLAGGRRGGLAIAAGAGISLVWCQLGASGALGVAFAVLYAAGTAVDARARASTSARGPRIIAALGIVCLAATPAGFAYPGLAWRALDLGGACAAVLPLAPDVAAPLARRFGLTLVVLAGLAAGVRGRGLRDAIPALASLVAALAAGPAVGLLGVVGAPVLAASAAVAAEPAAAAGAGTGPARRGRLAIATARGGAALGLLVALAGALVAGFAEPYRPPASSTRFVAGLAATRGIVACGAPAWCDVAEAIGLRVLADERVALAPAAVRADQALLASAGPGWRGVLARRGVGVLVLRRGAPLAALLALDPGWRAVRRRDSATAEMVAFRPAGPAVSGAGRGTR